MSLSFDTHPDRYRHWKLSLDGELARLTMGVDPHGGLRDDYELKLNSYDLGVDIELADAVQRLRFEHPEVKAVIIESANERVFCAGANIPMLGTSSHAFKVNFCKFTNETRLSIEDASANSGQRYLAALLGTCAGGGYELALACDDIVLVDDGNSAVSLPEVPLLGVLPGTGGLTRLVDKRKVRRDRADVFCTTSEGMRGKRAVEWGLVDAIASKTKFADTVRERAHALAKLGPNTAKGPGIALDPVKPAIDGTTYTYTHVRLAVSPAARTAELVIDGPTTPQPKSADDIQAAGAAQWSLRAFREIDDALLRLRIEHLDVGLLVVKTRGELEAVAAADESLWGARSHWLAHEILLLQARVLRRLDLTSRSLFAVIDQGSCFAGSLLELALACDRIYMLEDDDGEVAVRVTPQNGGAFPMSHGSSRLVTRFLKEPDRVAKVLATTGNLRTTEADALGLVTIAPDEIDWEDDVRIAIEERVSISPDALTGMEASLRFPGAESGDSKIFSRLSAWQNWIFQRPNAVGPQGALTRYGQPERPVFDWKRC